MIRDLMGILLIATGGSLFFIMYYLIRTGIRVKNARFWPLTAMPTSMKLAGVFANMALMLVFFGYRIMEGDRPIHPSVIVLVLSMTLWSCLLWWDFAHPPARIEVEDDNGKH